MVRTRIAVFAVTLAALPVAVPRAHASPGQLDSTFGTGGIVTTAVSFNSYDRPYALAVDDQPTRFVVAGSAGGTVAVARYNLDGTLDTTFSSDGLILDPVPGCYTSSAHAVAVQSDHKIVVVGECGGGAGQQFLILRYNPNGSLDSTFGSGGRVYTHFGTDTRDFGRALAIRTTAGQIIVAGYSINTTAPSPNYDFAVARYLLSNGALDTTFNGTGTVVADLGASKDDFATAVSLKTGRILAAGYGGNAAGNDDMVVLQLNTNGTIDAGFASNGIGRYDLSNGGDDRAFAIADVPGGPKRMLVGESFSPQTGLDFATVRIRSDGALDNTFAGAGKVISPMSFGPDAARAVAIQSDDRVVVAGFTTSNVGGTTDIAVRRYNADGSVDTTFAGGGVVTAVGTAVDAAQALGIQPDGKLVVAGRTSEACPSDCTAQACDTCNFFGPPSHCVRTDDFVLLRYLQ